MQNSDNVLFVKLKPVVLKIYTFNRIPEEVLRILPKMLIEGLRGTDKMSFTIQDLFSFGLNIEQINCLVKYNIIKENIKTIYDNNGLFKITELNSGFILLNCETGEEFFYETFDEIYNRYITLINWITSATYVNKEVNSSVNPTKKALILYENRHIFLIQVGNRYLIRDGQTIEREYGICFESNKLRVLNEIIDQEFPKEGR